MNGAGRILAAVLIAAGAIGFLAVPSQAKIGLEAIEARVGLASLEDDAGSTFIISAAADMGMLTKDLGLEFNADFWTKGWGDEEVAEWTWTNIAFLANLRYAFPMKGGSFHPFAFGGIGFSYWKADWDCKYCDDEIWGDLSESGIEFGLDLGLGADFGSGEGMMPTVRAGYNTNGGGDYLFIQGGLKFPVGK